MGATELRLHVSSPVINIIRTKPRGDRVNPTTEYAALLHTVRDAGLLRRRTGFYIALFAGLTVALGAAFTGVVFLGDSW